MNIQKIQTSTKGFTLVELIVVITILVILGTIAFLNLGGFSASARDSQRVSDLNQINQQVMTMQAKSAMSYMNMLSGTTAKLDLAAAKVGGTGATTSDYNAGNVNYTVLGVDQAKFQDPTSTVAYRMAATTRAGNAYELGAKLEETSTALVIGTYMPRGTGATATASGTYTAATKTLVITTGLGAFKINDYIIGTTGSAAKVTSISADLTKITVETDVAASGNYTLAAPEVLGLIGSGTTVVTNKGTNLPY